MQAKVQPLVFSEAVGVRVSGHLAMTGQGFKASRQVVTTGQGMAKRTRIRYA